MPLTPDKSYTVNFKSSSLSIKQKIIPPTARSIKNIAEWCYKGDLMKPNAILASDGRARGIVVHNTPAIKVKGTTMSEQYTRATWPNCNMNGVVVHFYCCPIEAWQNLDLTEQGWHATDGGTRTRGHATASYKTVGGNLDCVAVEIIGKESEENGARLVAYLLHHLNLTIYDVYTHNYFISSAVYGNYPNDGFIQNSYKNCPIYILDHWQSFLDKVSMYLKELSEKQLDLKPTPIIPTVVPSPQMGTSTSQEQQKPKKVLHLVQVGAFSKKSNADNYLLEAKKRGFKDSYVTSTTTNGNTLYRVQVGAFSSKENAMKYAKEANSKGFASIIVQKEC